MKQDLLYEAWVMLAYNNPRPVLTSSERGRINRGLKELREIGATPQELKAKWGAYKAKWAKLGNPSITALTGNWNTLGTRISTPQASKRPSYLDTPSPTPEGLKHAQELLPPALRKRLEAKHQ